MDNAENDLLISAYLDGELNAEERAHVEQLLASSAEARQLVDELRALRASLQELPQHTLELEFAQRVLVRAEREMAASQVEAPIEVSPAADESIGGDQSLAKIQPAGSVARTLQPAASQMRRILSNRRGLGWSCAAIAVALVVMVTSRHPAEPNKPATPQAGGDQVAMGPSPAASSSSNRAAPVDVAPINQPPAGQPGAGDIASDQPALRQPQPSAEANSHEYSRLNSSSIAENKPAKVDDVKDLDMTTPNSPTAGAVRSLGVNPIGSKSEVAGNGRLSDLSDDFLVVEVEISPAAAQRGDFVQTLAKHNIALEDSPLATEFAADRLKRDQAQGEQKDNASVDELRGIVTKSREQSEAEKALVDRFAEGQANSVRSYNFAKSPAPNEHFDFYYVQASPEQIKGAVADLRGTPQAFPSVTYSAAQPVVENEVLESLGQRNRQLSREKAAESIVADSGTVDGSPVDAPAAVNRRGTAARGGRGGGQRYGISGQADEARSNPGGGGFGGGMGGAGAQNSFGGGGFGGNAAQPAPAQNLSASESSKEAELKKWNEAADAKLPERDKIDFDANQQSAARKPAALPNEAAQSAGAVTPLQTDGVQRGRAQRLALPELGRRLAAGAESATPKFNDQTDAKPAQQNNDGGGKQAQAGAKDGLELYLKPSKELPLSEVQQPQPPVAAVPTSGEKQADARGADADLSKRRDQGLQFNYSNANGAVQTVPLKGTAAASSSPATVVAGRATEGITASAGPRRALFVLRVLDAPPPAAAIPAAAEPSAGKPAGGNP
jgi:anti-sigma factor RsiW